MPLAGSPTMMTTSRPLSTVTPDGMCAARGGEGRGVAMVARRAARRRPRRCGRGTGGAAESLPLRAAAPGPFGRRAAQNADPIVTLLRGTQPPLRACKSVPRLSHVTTPKMRLWPARRPTGQPLSHSEAAPLPDALPRPPLNVPPAPRPLSRPVGLSPRPATSFGTSHGPPSVLHAAAAAAAAAAGRPSQSPQRGERRRHPHIQPPQPTGPSARTPFRRRRPRCWTAPPQPPKGGCSAAVVCKKN